jgi:hypothetical protein
MTGLGKIERRHQLRQKHGSNRTSRTIHLDVLPPELGARDLIEVPYEKFGDEMFGICEPHELIAPGHPGYQRNEIMPKVAAIAAAMRRGGVTAPIHVVSRAWEKTPHKPRYWIVDGQQRFWASMAAAKPIQALIHTAASPEQERLLFKVLNDRHGLSANLKIFNHAGPVSRKLLIAENDDDTSPLFGKIQFTSSRASGRIPAATLITCLSNITATVGGAVEQRLARLDFYIGKEGLGYLRDFLHSLAMVFLLPPPGLNPAGSHLVAFAHAYKKSALRGVVDAKRLTRLRNVAARLHIVKATTYQETVMLMTQRILRVLRPAAAK